MTLEILGSDNAWHSILPYLAYNGLKWSRNDVDGPNAGRMQNAEMQRNRLATKYRWDLTCHPLTAQEQSVVLQLIKPEYVFVRYTDPETLQTVTDYYYSNNFPSTFAQFNKDGTELWMGLEFPLIQR